MSDAIELEKRGIPTVTIAHDAFESVAMAIASSLGIEELPLIVEPVSQMDDDESVELFATETFDLLIDALTSRE